MSTKSFNDCGSDVYAPNDLNAAVVTGFVMLTVTPPAVTDPTGTVPVVPGADPDEAGGVGVGEGGGVYEGGGGVGVGGGDGVGAGGAGGLGAGGGGGGGAGGGAIVD